MNDQNEVAAEISKRYNEKMQWLVGHDTGSSSIALFCRMEGLEAGYWDAPSDPPDLGRCLRLIARFPGYRKRLHEMAAVSSHWAELVKEWAQLEACYKKELAEPPAWPSNSRSTCYELMRTCHDRAWVRQPNGLQILRNVTEDDIRQAREATA